MKGLAQISPRMSRVKVNSRSARKHYGSPCGYQYEHKLHSKVPKGKK